MQDKTDNILIIEPGSQGPCRVSYSLNNDQPVRCTIIGDQPLFYMDYSDEIEDEFDFDDPFGFESIEAGLKNMQEKITAFESDYEADRLGEEQYGIFLEDMSYVTAENKSGQNAPKIEALLDILRQSRLASEYLQFGSQYGTKITYSAQVETATYDKDSGQILINPNLNHADRILLSLRELRRMWQHRNGALVHPLTFHPDQAILVNRVQMADLAVAMVRGAWELQLSEEKDAWERLENSSLGDLTRALAREAYMDFRTLNNGVASSAVFEAWFLSDRCRDEDRHLIQQMLADYQGYVFDSEQSSQQVTAELVIALGSVPFGKNYLAPYINTIIHDALFTEVRDRSNSNFLWFIKFEKSFRETEQELQNEESNKKGRENPFGQNQKEKRFGDHAEENIINLPSGEDGSNIISFQRRNNDR